MVAESCGGRGIFWQEITEKSDGRGTVWRKADEILKLRTART